MSEQYRIYLNWPTKKARIHRDNCGMCNQGNGVHSGKGESNGRWLPDSKHAPVSLEKAKAMAEATGLKVSQCGHCLRH